MQEQRLPSWLVEKILELKQTQRKYSEDPFKAMLEILCESGGWPKGAEYVINFGRMPRTMGEIVEMPVSGLTKKQVISFAKDINKFFEDVRVYQKCWDVVWLSGKHGIVGKPYGVEE